MCISLLKICALALLHRGSLKYFENSNGRLNGLRAANSDSSVGMMRLKEQKAIFTGLWITFWWLFKAQKSLSRKFPRGLFLKKDLISYCLKHHEFQKATHTCAFCFCCSPRSELTERDWENNVRRVYTWLLFQSVATLLHLIPGKRANTGQRDCLGKYLRQDTCSQII